MTTLVREQPCTQHCTDALKELNYTKCEQTQARTHIDRNALNQFGHYARRAGWATATTYAELKAPRQSRWPSALTKVSKKKTKRHPQRHPKRRWKTTHSPSSSLSSSCRISCKLRNTSPLLDGPRCSIAIQSSVVLYYYNN